jgi:type IV pilus assembly protein PilE
MESLSMKKNGFTLVELMITVAIVAILAAIAYPSYQDSIIKTKRAIAQGDLMELASFMERFFTENNQYHQTNAATPVAVSLPFSSKDDYTYALTGTLNATTFTLQATPSAGTTQASDTCANLRLTNTGFKSATGAGDCW